MSNDKFHEVPSHGKVREDNREELLIVFWEELSKEN